MSNDARIAIGLPAHPKTKKLIRRLGEGAAWRLVCLFLWAAQNRSDGDLAGMTAEDIELAVDWSGDDGAFVAGLIEVGFLDGCEGTYCIHDWEEHNPWAASSGDRSDKARWAAMCRRYGRAGAAERMPEYAARLPDALLDPASSRAVAGTDAATSMPLACFSSAPSPSPSPNPRSRADAPQDAAPPPEPEPEHRPRRGTRLPADWEPGPDRLAWARQERPDIDPIAEGAKFRDHWTAKPGKDGTKLDWDATWRNWIRNSRGSPARDGPLRQPDGRPQSRAVQALQNLAEVAPDVPSTDSRFARLGSPSAAPRLAAAGLPEPGRHAIG